MEDYRSLALAAIMFGPIFAFLLWSLVGKYPSNDGFDIFIAVVLSVVYSLLVGIFVLATSVGTLITGGPLGIAVPITLFLFSLVLSALGGYRVGQEK